MTAQPGILAAVPRVGRHLLFRLREDAQPAGELARLACRPGVGETIVLGVGPSTVRRLGHDIPGLRELPALAGAGVSIPSTPAALWCWLRGDDQGELVLLAHAIASDLADAYALDAVVDAFRFREGRDLSGYVDGTENPRGDAATAAAIVAGAGKGLDGSSFVSVQKWVHDLAAFDRLAPAMRDEIIGRRRSTDEEIEDAPAAAHVKRTAQESFNPTAFVFRRSMPWADATGAGLFFVAFGQTLDAFEAQLRRMVGLDDGIVDGLFRFTRPVSGAQFWCPPMDGSQLDLSAIGA